MVFAFGRSDHQPSARRPWFNKFRNALTDCADIGDIEHLVRVKVQRWRGRSPYNNDEEDDTPLADDGSPCIATQDLLIPGYP